jgi:hypothetical protein
MFGRVTPTPDQFAVSRQQVMPAPRLSVFGLPRQSPRIEDWILRRTRVQYIGSCVGQSGANVLETLCRMSNPFDATVMYHDSPALSPLFMYAMARKYSYDHGTPVFGEGAIVSHAAAAAKGGVALYDLWPDTKENQLAYRDFRIPDAAQQGTKIKPYGEPVLIYDPDQILEYLSLGIPVWIGTPWRGGSRTDSKGRFPWSGMSIGGHATLLGGYNLDAAAGVGEIAVGNSWPGWGLEGCIGYTAWCNTKRRTGIYYDLTADKLRNGVSEAVAFLDAEWMPEDPKPEPEPEPDPQPDPEPEPEPEPPPPPEPSRGPAVIVYFDGKAWSGRLTEVPGLAPPANL